MFRIAINFPHGLPRQFVAANLNYSECPGDAIVFESRADAETLLAHCYSTYGRFSIEPVARAIQFTQLVPTPAGHLVTDAE